MINPTLHSHKHYQVLLATPQAKYYFQTLIHSSNWIAQAKLCDLFASWNMYSNFDKVYLYIQHINDITSRDFAHQ